MSFLSDHLKGAVVVPLSLLSSDGFAECPIAFSQHATVPQLQDFLQDPQQPITGIVTPHMFQDMLKVLDVSENRFQRTLNDHNQSLHNNTSQIDCLLGSNFLEKAKAVLGGEFKCKIRIYCIPPGKYCDGEILRQILNHSDDSDGKAFYSWMHRLSDGKQKHVRMLMRHRQIWTAMQALVPFAGHWEDVHIGNFAKHLAAHCNDMIVNYWDHINTVWSKIFDGIMDKRHLLDIRLVHFLQYKAPHWSDEDRRDIQKAFKSIEYFPKLNDGLRAKLMENILSLKVVIPSILTFQENIRYITLGVKILEKYVAKPFKKVRGPSKGNRPKPEQNLFRSLEQDWSSPNLDGSFRANVVETAEFEFKVTANSASARVSFVGILLSALRNMVYLGSEQPLQDIKGKGTKAYLVEYQQRCLCETAMKLGFRNDTILQGLGLPGTLEDLWPIKVDSMNWSDKCNWRGGKPTIHAFRALKETAFLPNIFQVPRNLTEPTPEMILGDLLRAFFKDFEVPQPLNMPEVDLGSYGNDVQMDNGISENQQMIVIDHQQVGGDQQEMNAEFQQQVLAMGNANYWNPKTPDNSRKRYWERSKAQVEINTRRGNAQEINENEIRRKRHKADRRVPTEAERGQTSNTVASQGNLATSSQEHIENSTLALEVPQLEPERVYGIDPEDNQPPLTADSQVGNTTQAIERPSAIETMASNKFGVSNVRPGSSQDSQKVLDPSAPRSLTGTLQKPIIVQQHEISRQAGFPVELDAEMEHELTVPTMAERGIEAPDPEQREEEL